MNMFIVSCHVAKTTDFYIAPCPLKLRTFSPYNEINTIMSSDLEIASSPLSLTGKKTLPSNHQRSSEKVAPSVTKCEHQDSQNVTQKVKQAENKQPVPNLDSEQTTENVTKCLKRSHSAPPNNFVSIAPTSLKLTIKLPMSDHSLVRKKSSVNILFSRAHASSFLRNSQLVEFCERPDYRQNVDSRTQHFEAIVESCLRLKLLSRALYEDCMTLEKIMATKIEEQNADSNMTEIQGWLCLLHESIGTLLNQGKESAPNLNMDPATEREDLLIFHKWESRFPSVLRGVRDKFLQVEESTNQLMLVYRYLKKRLSRLYATEITTILKSVISSHKSITTSVNHSEVQPLILSKPPGKRNKSHQILYVHYGVDGISLKTNWKLKFLRFSKLVKQSEKISMIDVFLWKLKKHPRQAEILLDEMSTAFVGGNNSDDKSVCIHELVEELVKLVKKRDKEKWTFLPKQRLILVRAFEDSKSEFDSLEKALNQCVETCKSCSQLINYLYTKGKILSKGGNWPSGNGFVVDKFSYFQVQIDRNEKDSFEKSKNGRNKEYVSACLKMQEKLPECLASRNERNSIKKENHSEHDNISTTPKSLSEVLPARLSSHAELLRQESLLNSALVSYKYGNIEDECRTFLKQISHTGQILPPMLEHCSLRPKNFHLKLVESQHCLRQIHSDNFTSAGNKLQSANKIYFTILFKLLSEGGERVPNFIKSQITREFETVRSWLKNVKSSLQSYLELLDRFSEYIQCWEEQICCIDEEFEHLYEVAPSIVTMAQKMHAAASEIEDNSITTYPNDKFSLLFSDVGQNLKLQLNFEESDEKVKFFVWNDLDTILEVFCIPLRGLSRSLAYILAQICQAVLDLKYIMDEKLKPIQLSYLNPGFKTPKYHTLEKVIPIVTLLDLRLQFSSNSTQAEDFCNKLKIFGETMDVLQSVLGQYEFLPKDVKLAKQVGPTIFAQIGEDLCGNLFLTIEQDSVAKLGFQKLSKQVTRWEQNFEIQSKEYLDNSDDMSELLISESQSSFIDDKKNRPSVLRTDPRINYHQWCVQLSDKMEQIVTSIEYLTKKPMLSMLSTLLNPLACPKLTIESIFVPKSIGLCRLVNQMISTFGPSQLFSFKEPDKKLLRQGFLSTTRLVESFRNHMLKLGTCFEAKMLPSMISFEMKSNFAEHSDDNEGSPNSDIEIMCSAMKTCVEESNKFEIVFENDAILCGVDGIRFEEMAFKTRLSILAGVLDEISEVYAIGSKQIEDAMKDVYLTKSILSHLWSLFSRWKNHDFLPEDFVYTIYTQIRKNVLDTIKGYRIMVRMAAECRYLLSYSICKLKIWMGDTPGESMPLLKSLDVEFLKCLISKHVEIRKIFFTHECPPEYLSLLENTSKTSLDLEISPDLLILSPFTKKVIQKNFITATLYCSELLTTAIMTAWSILESSQSQKDFYNEFENDVPLVYALLVTLIWAVGQTSAFFKDCSSEQILRLKKGFKFLKYSLANFTMRKQNKLSHTLCHKLEKVEQKICKMEKMFEQKFHRIIPIKTDLFADENSAIHEREKANSSEEKLQDYDGTNVIYEGRKESDVNGTFENSEELEKIDSNCDLEDNSSDDGNNENDTFSFVKQEQSESDKFSLNFRNKTIKIYSDDFFEDPVLKMARHCINKKKIWTVSCSIEKGMILKKGTKFLSTYFDLKLGKKVEICINILEYLCVLFNEAEVKLEAQRDAIAYVNRLVKKHLTQMESLLATVPLEDFEILQYQSAFKILKEKCSTCDKMLTKIFNLGSSCEEILEKIRTFSELKLSSEFDHNLLIGKQRKKHSLWLQRNDKIFKNNLYNCKFFMEKLQAECPVNVQLPLFLSK